ncbi:Bifunctional polymyxin resistance protein ArnA [Euphorbia peplus]|nr:Bifunctional polymyxin resistance protein ArnA [Euphorbia peplus]
MEPLKICIIGGAGFIGMNICKQLIEETPHTAIILDVSDKTIAHILLDDRMEFHKINIKTEFSRLEAFVMQSDIIINLETFREPADYKSISITSAVLYETNLIAYCIDNAKRLIHFSTSDVYGKTTESLLPEDHPLRENPEFYTLKEDVSPCILGSVVDRKWSFACAKQLTERLILDAGTDSGLNFTIVRPFNWIGPRSDLIPGTDDDLRDDVPSTLARFTQNLFKGEQLSLVDGGDHQRTFCSIDYAVEAVLLIIDNPEKANRQIFNVGNKANEVSVRNLATMMMMAYAKVSNVHLDNLSTCYVSAEEFYGRAYNVSYRRIPDTTNIRERLGWGQFLGLEQEVSDLQQLLEKILAYHADVHHVPSPASKKPRIGNSSDAE